MKKQYKILIAIVLVIMAAGGGYYCYQKYSLSKIMQTSYGIMKDKSIQQNDIDNSIVKDILKNDSNLEYAYISHNGETVMLNLKFRKEIQNKDKYVKLSRYMKKVRAEYKGRNVNAMIVDN